MGKKPVQGNTEEEEEEDVSESDSEKQIIIEKRTP